MKEFRDVTLSIMEDIADNVGSIFTIVGIVLWIMIVVVTSPIWIVPYWIYTRKGDAE